MGAIRSAGASVIASVGVAWACGGAGAFACSDDDQCANTGELGRCESTGYCSFVDEACPSGHRYGARAPSDLAEACVPPDDATSIADTAGTTDHGTTGESPDPTASTSLTTSTPVDPTTSDDTTTTMPTSDTTPPVTTESGDPDEGEAEAASTTMTQPGDPPCMPTFVDEFDDGALDPFWQTWADAGTALHESNGHIEFTIGASEVDWISTGLYSDTTNLLGGHVRVELVGYTEPLDAVSVWLTAVGADDCEVQITAYDTTVGGNSGGVGLPSVPAPTDAPLWLQLRIDHDAIVYWEWSTDGTVWNELHSAPSPCDLTSAWTAVFAGGAHQYARPVTQAMESFERCEAP